VRVGKPRRGKGKADARLSGASSKDATLGLVAKKKGKSKGKTKYRKMITRTPLHKAIASLGNLTPTAKRRITEARADTVDPSDLVMFMQAQTELAIGFYNGGELTAKELMVSLRWIGGLLQAAVQLCNEAGNVAPGSINVTFNLQSNHIADAPERTIRAPGAGNGADAIEVPAEVIVTGDDRTCGDTMEIE